MKSKKGKQASKRIAIKQLTKLIDEKFKNCNFDDRRQLFEDLQVWAKDNLGETQYELFIEALYNAQSTQDIQLTIGLEKALNKIELGGKKQDDN